MGKSRHTLGSALWTTAVRSRGERAARPCEGPLPVRIGIHTDHIVIGEIGSREKREILAIGETPNLAAGTQGQAEPDEVGDQRGDLSAGRGLFACEERGQPELKGVATPLTLYRVVKEGEAQSRFQVVARRGLTPLVGRDHEYGLLRERWARVKDGERPSGVAQRGAGHRQIAVGARRSR